MITAAETENYNAATKELTLEVLPIDLSKATATISGTCSYVGKAQTPAVKVDLNGVILKDEVDYRVIYTNNIKWTYILAPTG